ncbi:MAG: chemotaxis protein CheC [Butyrivibrio sp.]
MAKIKLDGLDDTQYDVLKEIGNIGAGNATTALAQLMNTKIDMSVPKVSLVPFNGISGIIGSEETVLVGILLGLSGDVNGMMMFLLKERSAHNLVNMLLGYPMDRDNPFDEMELSALNEIGNIITGSYLSALSGLTNLVINASVPSLSIDMAGALLSVPAIEYGKVGDKVLLIQTQFGEGDLLDGYFLMVPELESYERILTSLGL